VKCTVCQGAGKLGPLPCGRCAGRGRALNYALFDLLAFCLVIAGIVGALGYAAVTHHRVYAPADGLSAPRPLPAHLTDRHSVHW
jgi:hypothetical protein